MRKEQPSAPPFCRLLRGPCTRSCNLGSKQTARMGCFRRGGDDIAAFARTCDVTWQAQLAGGATCASGGGGAEGACAGCGSPSSRSILLQGCSAWRLASRACCACSKRAVHWAGTCAGATPPAPLCGAGGLASFQLLGRPVLPATQCITEIWARSTSSRKRRHAGSYGRKSTALPLACPAPCLHPTDRSLYSAMRL